MFGKINKTVGIVCNDAGSANIIIHWVINYNYNYLIKVSGPAKQIFREMLPNKKINYDLIKLIKKSDIIISGTSAKSNIDHKARLLSKKNGKKVIGLLDHWTLYKEGFTYNNKFNLPSEIWVTNKKASTIAKKKFKNSIIKIKKNILEEKISNIKKKNNRFKNYLYLLEPLDNNTEFFILKKFFRFLKKNNLEKKIELIFKVHPSENSKKYFKFIRSNYSSKFKILKNNNIIEIIRWSDIVFGLRSYALVLALKAKRKVFTLLPIRNFKFTLPYKKINSLNRNSQNYIVKKIDDIKN